VLVEGATTLPQELPLFHTTLLLEACRCGDERILLQILAREDVNPNVCTTALQCTAFADACARGDLVAARLLLDDPRVDPCIGDRAVTHPLLYACITGDTELLELAAARGLLTDAIEGSLVATAAANGQQAAREAIESHFMHTRPFDTLSRKQQERKVRFVCATLDPASTG